MYKMKKEDELKGGKCIMEIRINVDDNKLREFGLEGMANEVARSFAPQFSKIIFGGGFGRGIGRGRPNMRVIPIRPVKSPKIEIDREVTKEEVKSIEDTALLNLKKDVKKILGKKEQEDLINFILDKLDPSALGKLIQK